MRPFRFLTTTLAISAVLALGSAARPALADGAAAATAPLSESLTGMAKADYASARVLFEDGDFQGALTKLKSSYEASKDPRLLWNMAACEKNLRHYAASLTLVERYLAEGSAVVTAEDRSSAESFSGTIREFVADVTVDVSQPGATIFVDDAAVGTSPLPGPVKVDMGAHKIRVHKDGFVDFVLPQELRGGTSVGLTAQLMEERHEGELGIAAGGKDVISVDGHVVGTGMWTGKLPSGTHSVEVTGKGKLPHRTEVMVKDGATNNVSISLQDEPRRAVAADSGGVPTWVWIGGAALLAGAGTGAYFLFKPGGQQYRDPQQGTWGAIQL